MDFLRVPRKKRSSIHFADGPSTKKGSSPSQAIFSGGSRYPLQLPPGKLFRDSKIDVTIPGDPSQNLVEDAPKAFTMITRAHTRFTVSIPENHCVIGTSKTGCEDSPKHTAGTLEGVGDLCSFSSSSKKIS